MLSKSLVIGTRIFGLRPLLMKTQTPTAASYRVVPTGSGMAVEFSGQPARAGSGSVAITTLPYKVGAINSTPMTGSEVISGEFGGCIMVVYKRDDAMHCGHVCTQSGYSKRSDWDAGVASGTYKDVKQLDTLGMVAGLKGATLNTSVLCVANAAGDSISHVYVEKEKHKFHKQGVLQEEDSYRVIKVGG